MGLDPLLGTFVLVLLCALLMEELLAAERLGIRV